VGNHWGVLLWVAFHAFSPRIDLNVKCQGRLKSQGPSWISLSLCLSYYHCRLIGMISEILALSESGESEVNSMHSSDGEGMFLFHIYKKGAST
jgi:hypothetical protein